jgi:hypothetical protein
MKTIYVTMIHDQHVDPVLSAYADRETAVQQTSKGFAKVVRFPESIEVVDAGDPFILYLSYPPAGSMALVVQVDLNTEPPEGC